MVVTYIFFLSFLFISFLTSFLDDTICLPYVHHSFYSSVCSDEINGQVLDMKVSNACPFVGQFRVRLLHQRGIQLILAYSWTRPAILVAGKGRGGMFLFLLFLHFHSCSSFFPVPLSSLLLCLLSLFSLSLGDDTK